jgi:carboxyl-terminal processing protease
MKNLSNKFKVTKGAKSLLGVIALVIVFFVGHLSGIYLYTVTEPDGLHDSEDGYIQQLNDILGQSSSDITAEDFNLLLEVYGDLQKYYIDSDLPDKDKFVASAAKGLVNALEDKYTEYYTPEEWQQIQEGNSGKFEGVGIKLTPGEGYVQIESPIKGGPAEAAGIMARDLIIKVDGKEVGGYSVTKVAQLIRGEEGTEVNLKVYRPDTEEQHEFEIERSRIDLKSIDYQVVGRALHIEVTQFTESDMAEFKSQWNRAVEVAKSRELNGKSFDGVILDLRNNTGGWVSAARMILEEFLPEGTVILREQDRNGTEVQIKTQRAGELQDVKLVVLVNEGSASASEIVAGALQDLGRAKLVGKSTVGKGVEQIIETTSDGGSIFIVYKKWLTPNGKNLSDENALKPDVEVDLTIDDLKVGRDPQLEEALGHV